MKARLHKSRQQLDTMSVSTVENVGFRWLKYLTLITDFRARSHSTEMVVSY